MGRPIAAVGDLSPRSPKDDITALPGSADAINYAARNWRAPLLAHATTNFRLSYTSPSVNGMIGVAARAVRKMPYPASVTPRL